MRILVAEDDLRLARAIKRVFEEESHQVKIVGDGKGAFGEAAAQPYDVMILDVMLPEMDGFEVCRRIRGDGSDMPVLMLTARADVTDRVKGLDCGADDYMVKPFAVAELLARVRALGRRGRAAAGGQLRAGDLVLDISKHSAIRNGREIELTVKEFQLLELMLRHQGQVLTRAQILDHVWQYDRNFASNVVDIYVHYLRNKVDKGFKTQMIRTVRGVGYTLSA
ncbi:MAG TPA: response regulator transcription factor [Dehalococcoidia bacterium]|jgi:DNA-binding response OmpR family regulator|nr:response regulator transcription factor [Dehalococcoidia bacterium]